MALATPFFSAPLARNVSNIHHGAHLLTLRDREAPGVSLDTSAWERLVQRAVDAAMAAGARYADARLTHTLVHPIRFVNVTEWHETRCVGVRALVNGYWGFSAMPCDDSGADGGMADVVRLAHDAVAQAKMNARGTPRTVELAAMPPAIGHWTMPVKIDPFAIPIEEKLAHLQYWLDYSHQVGHPIDPLSSSLYFVRQERVVATSEGSHFTQTVYESGGTINVVAGTSRISLRGLTPATVGWELALDADIPAQLRGVDTRIAAEEERLVRQRPAVIGRYTLVCDGETMAALVDRTLGIPTQLDRALGYEANASGTSFLDDPLAMLGTFQVGSPLVTVTANRSMPRGLATVKWDDEGVAPAGFTLIKNGVLTDYQTTREQASWLAPYYTKTNQPVRSHGCAATDSARSIPMQHMPNLVLAPSAGEVSVDDLVATVSKGILIRGGQVKGDYQVRTGELSGAMQEIRNGRLATPVIGGAFAFNTMDLWKNVTAIGGSATRGVIASTVYPNLFGANLDRWTGAYPVKGEPPQRTSYSVSGVAAVIANQPLINPARKA